MRASRLIPTAAAALLAAAPAGAQFTIGDPVVGRTFTDAFSRFIVVSEYVFPAGAFGQEVQSINVFGGPPAVGPFNNVGREFVPLLVTDPSGGSFEITGIGAQRTVAPGVQTFAFGLTAGSAVIGAGTRMAWYAVTNAPVHFDNDADGNAIFYTANAAIAPGTLAVGNTYTVVGNLDRAYSIQFSTTPVVSAVPEPGPVALVAGGLLALAWVARRRRA